MEKPRPPFTWHYYVMALGAFAAMMALTLLAWGSVISAIGFAVVSHPQMRFSAPVRSLFLILFAVMYVFAFPDPEVIRAQMLD